METTVPTETVTKVIEVVEQMDYTEYLVKLPPFLQQFPVNTL